MDAAQIGLQIAMIVIGTLVVGMVGIYIFINVRNKKRFDTTCIIFQKVSNSLVIDWDKGGTFVDSKTNNKRFFLAKNKVGLNPDNIPFILDLKVIKIVFLHKFGLKNFQYVKINLDQAEQLKISVGEEDVNWGINAYEKQKKIFGGSLLEKLLPYFGILIMGLIIIILVVIVMRDLKEIMPVLQATVEALNNAAQAIAQASSGTTVIPS